MSNPQRRTKSEPVGRPESAIGWLRFVVGERSYALPLEAIAEVTRASRPRLIPRVPLRFGGVVNFRGEPLPAIDGGAALQDEPSRTHQHLLVLQRDTLRLGLLVSHVSRIDRALPAGLRKCEFEASPKQGFVSWYSQGETLLGLVEPDGLIDRAKELLGEQRSEGEPNSCHNAF